MMDLLERFVVAVERIATALETPGTAPAATTEAAPARRRRKKKDEPAPPAASPPTEPDDPAEATVTRDMVREALRIFRKSNDKAAAVAILEENGCNSISSADESALPAILKAFSA